MRRKFLARSLRRIGHALGLGILAIGLLGAAGNVAAAAVCCVAKRLRSVFNQILVCNLAIHTLYVFAAIAIQAYKELGGETFTLVFCNFLYAFKPMLMHSSTCLTVLMARERHKVSRRWSLRASHTWAQGFTTQGR